MTFQPGISGNPGGRPGGLEHIRRLARTQSPRALATLRYWMSQRDPKLAFASIAAANALLDRAWGKPATDPEAREVLSVTIRKIFEINPEQTTTQSREVVTIDHEPQQEDRNE